MLMMRRAPPSLLERGAGRLRRSRNCQQLQLDSRHAHAGSSCA